MTFFEIMEIVNRKGWFEINNKYKYSNCELVSTTDRLVSGKFLRLYDASYKHGECIKYKGTGKIFSTNNFQASLMKNEKTVLSLIDGVLTDKEIRYSSGVSRKMITVILKDLKNFGLIDYDFKSRIPTLTDKLGQTK